MDKVTCSKCSAVFVKRRRHGRMCQSCINARQRTYRAQTGELHTKRYEKTPQGFLMRLYRNMKSRVTGVTRAKSHLYLGKELVPRDVFYQWATDQATFWELYHQWTQSGFERRFTPSVDRVDSSQGYTLDNMEWVPFHENCRRGGRG